MGQANTQEHDIMNRHAHTHEQLNIIIDVMYSKLELNLTLSFSPSVCIRQLKYCLMGLILFVHLVLFIYFYKIKITSSKTYNGIPHYQYSYKANKSTI